MFSGRCLRVRPDKEKIDPGYLSYFFGMDRFKEYIRSIAVGATMPSINTTILSNVPVAYPPLSEQRRIASILGNLDDQIENNRKIAKTLEAMAQTIFQSWFVDFDPVRAKMAGESRESICKRLKITPEILDLFPDRLADSELGEIPEGWNIGQLGEIVGFQNGYAFKSKDWQDSGVPVVKIGSVQPGFVDLSSASFVSKEIIANLDDYSLQPADLVIGMTGYVGQVGLVPISTVYPMLNQRVGRLVLRSRGTKRLPFSYCLTTQQTFKEAVISKAHGTAQANVSSNAILSINVINPNEELQSVFDNSYFTLFDHLLSVEFSSRLLEELRDSLLPELMAGKITIPRDESNLMGNKDARP